MRSSPPPGAVVSGGVPQTYPTYVMFAEGGKEGVSGVTIFFFFFNVTANVIVLFF